MAWAEDIIAVLGRGDPLPAILELPSDARRIESFDVTLFFDVPPPAGVLSREIATLDRAFRLGARVAETGVPLDPHHRRRGIPILAGMTVEAVDPGSLWVALKPSKRILKSIGTGVVVVGTALGYLNGAYDALDNVFGDDESESPVYAIPLPTQPAPTVRIELRRDDESVELELKVSGEHYRLEKAKPLPQLEP
jgi:hypothetical protein